jgi:hypothetical protein
MPWMGVAEKIEATVLGLWSVPNRIEALVVTLDVLFVGQDIRAAVELASALPPERVITAASHNHRAPQLDATKPRLGAVDPNYLATVRNRLSQTVQDVLASQPTPVRLFANQSVANHSINRRRFKPFVLQRSPKFCSLEAAPSRSGFRDETIITATLRASGNVPIAVLWNYACHPVGLERANAVSAHFPGRVRQAIRVAESSPDLPVLYFQGFSGNTRPSQTARLHSRQRKLRALVQGPLFEDMTPDGFASWAQSLTHEVASCRKGEQLLPADSISVVRVARSAATFYVPGDGDVTWSRLDLGSDFSLVGMSCEVVAEYAPIVRNMMQRRFVCCVGCLDHSRGYIPTAAMLDEGGYEALGFCKNFGLESVHPQVEISTREGFATVARHMTTQRTEPPP